MSEKRRLPNILITGTPGTGKSRMAELLSERTGLTWVDVSKFAIASQSLERFDEEYESYELDEDKLLDLLEPMMADGGKILDYHSSELFPERWFDIVFVMRTDNTILYDRLVARGYTGQKLKDNVSCEILQVLLDEARNSYKEEIVHELQSDTSEQIVDNVNRICQWIEQWKIDNP